MKKPKAGVVKESPLSTPTKGARDTLTYPKKQSHAQAEEDSVDSDGDMFVKAG